MISRINVFERVMASPLSNSKEVTQVLDKTREGFMFFRSYYEGAKELDDEQRLAFYDALIEYALNDTEPIISGVPKSCFACLLYTSRCV